MDRYETIRRQHDELTHRLDRLYVIASCRSSMLPQGRMRALLERELRSLGTLLANHFTIEESDGYLVDVTRARPSFNLRVTDLIRQHGDFLARQDELLAGVSQGAALDDVKAGILRLIDELEQHEQSEVAMLEAAPFDDVALGG